MARALITGVNGLLGKALAHSLATAGHEVVGVSLEDVGSALPPAVAYHRLDITDHAAVKDRLARSRVDVLIHLAALVHVRRHDLGYDDYARVNLHASEALFEAAVASGVSRFLFASTIEVYGPQPDGATVDEGASCRPETHYGRTKLLAEEALGRVGSRAGVPHCSMRLAPVYASHFRLNIDKRLYLRAPYVAYRMGSGDYRLSFCALRNIITWVGRWSTTPVPPSGAFNLADERCYSANELLALERVHGRGRVIVPMPRSACLAAIRAREAAWRALGRDPGMISVANFRKLERSVVWSAARARAALGELPGDARVDLYEEREV